MHLSGHERLRRLRISLRCQVLTLGAREVVIRLTACCVERLLHISSGIASVPSAFANIPALPSAHTRRSRGSYSLKGSFVAAIVRHPWAFVRTEVLPWTNGQLLIGASVCSRGPIAPAFRFVHHDMGESLHTKRYKPLVICRLQ